MYFAIFGTDNPGMAQQRRDTQDEVASYLRERPGHSDVTLHNAGPTLDEEGAINGSLLIVEAPSLEAVRAFLSDSPLQKMGFLGEVSIRQWEWKTGRPG